MKFCVCADISSFLLPLPSSRSGERQRERLPGCGGHILVLEARSTHCTCMYAVVWIRLCESLHCCICVQLYTLPTPCWLHEITQTIFAKCQQIFTSPHCTLFNIPWDRVILCIVQTEKYGTEVLNTHTFTIRKKDIQTSICTCANLCLHVHLSSVPFSNFLQLRSSALVPQMNLIIVK